ncbi:phospholipase D-like domain-containing protein [Streptomyces scabiei]|uniref:hypothetical protein n=1 Tax=Streptomyces scabiei TaxID=1930 RepID=UPI0038F7A639
MGEPVDGRGYLSADAIRVYGRIARQERLEEHDRRHVQELVAWGAVAFSADRPDMPVVLDPQKAAQRRLERELAEAAERVAMMKALPAVSDELALHYERAQWRAGGGSEFLDDPVTVNARLDDVVGSAEVEILAAQPGGPRTRELLNRAVTRDTEAVQRGVALRTLYRDTVRDHPVTAEGVRTMSGRGGQYRTLVGPFQRCIVVDRRQAFISDHVVEGAPAHAGWHVTDRALVAFIAVVFDEAWHRASPWHGELRTQTGASSAVDAVSGPASGVRTSALQRAILRDMAAGIEQRLTANRMGIRLRRLTDEIKDLKELLGVQTLPELTYWWALSPDRLVDDGAPATVDVAGAGIAGALGVETAA